MTKSDQLLSSLPLLPMSLGFAAGIALGGCFAIPFLWNSGLLPVICVLISALLYSRSPSRRLILLVLICLLLGVMRYGDWRHSQWDEPLADLLPLQAEALEVEVLRWGNGSGRSLVAGLRHITVDSLTQPVFGTAMLRLPWQSELTILPGQMLRLKDVQLDEANGPRNPGQFDFRQYLARRGIFAVCRVQRDDQIEIVPGAVALTAESVAMFPLRMRLIEALEAELSQRSAGLLKALLLGVRDDIDKHVKDDFAGAGVLHVLAISGLHVGFVAYLLLLCFSFLPIRQPRRNLIVILGLFGYMCLTAANPPVVRATLMAALLLFARNLERRCHPYQFLLVAVSAILVWEPAQLFRVDFQFSCGAVLSILFFYPRLKPLMAWLTRALPKGRWRHFIATWVIMPGCLSIAAQIGTMPLTAFYFQQISPISFLTSIVVIPLVALLVALGSLLMLLAVFGLTLAADIAILIEILSEVLNQSVAFAADVPFATISIARPGAIEILIYLSLLSWLFALANKKLRQMNARLLLLGIVLHAIASISAHSSFQMLMLDVGQGDAAIVSTPAGVHLGIDAGPANAWRDSGEDVIEPVMRYLSISRLNHLFISHAHLDHIGGAFYLVQQGLVGKIYLPEPAVKEALTDSLIAMCRQLSVDWQYLQAGDIVEIDRDTKVYVLSPPVPIPSTDELNNYSLVLQIQHRDQRLLFTGDIEQAAEAALLSWEDLLRSDVLKIAHHGSSTSSSEAFLEAVHPKTAVISCAENSRFGHPSPRVVARLNALGISVRQTPQEGAVWLDSFGDD